MTGLFTNYLPLHRQCCVEAVLNFEVEVLKLKCALISIKLVFNHALYLLDHPAASIDKLC